MNTNIDKSNLRQVILDFPNQFKNGFKLAENIKVQGEFKSICISGMGGSSIPADILNVYKKYLIKKDSKANRNFQIYKNRNYNLPNESYENCLNIFSSYSGNTEETLNSLKEAIKNNLPSLGLANGGKLIEICKEKNIPYILIPKISQPRYALGYFVSALLQILENHGFIQNFSEDILNSVKKLEDITKEMEEKGKSLAHNLTGKTPIIHVSERFKAVGRISKIKINENSKTPCFYNYYPELNHNEMVGFALPQAKFHILTLIDRKNYPQITKRMEITPKLLKEKGIEATLIEIPLSDNYFLELFSSLALFDWISYYLALEYGQDPTPVDIVEDFKKLL